MLSFFFFFHDTSTTEIYTLSLHDALPIYPLKSSWRDFGMTSSMPSVNSCILRPGLDRSKDRKSTRLNSSHVAISYAVFCLKKKMAHLEIPFAGHTDIKDEFSVPQPGRHDH